MRVFSTLGNFFKHLFQRSRPNLDKFLQKYEGLAISELTRLKGVYNDAGLHEWEEHAFETIKAEVVKDGHEIYDNWVGILIRVAYEEIKGAAVANQ